MPDFFSILYGWHPRKNQAFSDLPGSRGVAEMWDYILYLMNAPFGRTRVPSPTNLKMCDRTKPNVHLSRVPSTSYASAPERCVHRVKYVIPHFSTNWHPGTTPVRGGSRDQDSAQEWSWDTRIGPQLEQSGPAREAQEGTDEPECAD